MSLIATAVKHLLAAGVSGDDLVRAIAEMEASAPSGKDAVAERRRQWDRERKRAERAREDAYLSGGNPPDPVDSVETADRAPALDKSPQTPKINPTPHVCVGGASARKAPAFPVPTGCDPDDWRDLLANRKSKRLPMTPAAYRKLIRDLGEQSDEEWPPGKVLRHAAEKGWAAIFDPRERPGSRNGQHRTSTIGPDEIQNVRLRAAVGLDAERDRGQSRTGF
jgi:hypothetical protein